MSRRKIICAVTALVLLQLAWVEVAGAFSFCFSFGGNGNHRSRAYAGHIPAIGFRPDYWQAYPAGPSAYGWYVTPETPLSAQQQDGRGTSPDRRQ